MAIKSILLVCIGNICRSPMAQALFARAFPQSHVVSAGTSALIGQPADPTAQQLMAARGLDISAHRAQQVSKAMCQQADIVLVMDRELRRALTSRYPTSTGKVFRLCEFLNSDVPDPYRQPQEMFSRSLELIDLGVNAWTQRMNKL